VVPTIVATLPTAVRYRKGQCRSTCHNRALVVTPVRNAALDICHCPDELGFVGLPLMVVKNRVARAEGTYAYAIDSAQARPLLPRQDRAPAQKRSTLPVNSVCGPTAVIVLPSTTIIGMLQSAVLPCLSYTRPALIIIGPIVALASPGCCAATAALVRAIVRASDRRSPWPRPFILSWIVLWAQTLNQP